MADSDKRVLSIQSHVVHGYVGNKASTFPLQLRGWDVDALNAVQFSNHTGYGSFKGYRLDGPQVEEIYEGLKSKDFEYNALLTGYLPSASVVDAVGRIGADLRARFPDLVWLLDPVMGDEGRLYVREDVVPAYKSILRSNNLVTIITPNHFEVELLTGVSLNTKADISKAFEVLHTEFGIPHVVISSMPHPKDSKKLLTIGSSARIEHADTGDKVTVLSEPFVIEQTKLESYFTGTGDLFAALLLDNYMRLGPENLGQAAAATISVLRRVLEKTWEYSKKHSGKTAQIEDSSMKFHELRLVQAAQELVNNEKSDNVTLTTLADF